MSYLEFSKQRYDAAIKEISRLKESEFPYPHIREALTQLEHVFQVQLDRINKIKPNSTPAIAKNACSQSLTYLFNYTPFLGFILRSTNVRNAFELYWPGLRLARQLLGDDTKLLFSSEWDYSPFVMSTHDLPEYVLIGVPAFESGNPLIMSLAGHEFGHNVWAKMGFGQKYGTPIRDSVLAALKGKHWAEFQGFQPTATQTNLTTDMFVQPAWLPAYLYASRQLEEIFCDMVGLRIFSESYLHAFAYLLSPGIPGERYPLYPSVVTRAKVLERASTQMGVNCPPAYDDQFSREQEVSSPVTKLLCAVADDAAEQLVDDVIADACQIADSKCVPKSDPDAIKEIVKCFRMVVPTDSPHSFADLLNAGWLCHMDPNLWDDIPQIGKPDRQRVLNDLVLKSLEITEFYKRLEKP